MVEVLVTGGAGFIGSNFVRYALEAHPDWRVTTLDKLTYAGRLENLHDVMDHPRHTFVHGDVARRGGRRAAGPARRTSSCTSPPRRTSTAPFTTPATSSRPTSSGRSCCSRRRAAPRRCSGSSRSRPTRCTAACPTGSSRETDELRPRNPYSASKAGADRLAYSYWATYGVPGHHHARVEQLRPVPVPREGHSALHHQRDRRHPGAALRRRAERARLAARRSITAAAIDLVIERGHDRRGLQHRRRQRGHATSTSRTASCDCWTARRRSSSRWPTARATTGATASTPRSCAASAGRRRPSSRTG